MTTLREAAQQALEALEKYRKMMFVEAGCRFGEGGSVITALRTALAEQPAEQESVQDEYNRVINHAIEQGIEASVFLRCWQEGDWSGCAEFGFEPNMAAYTAPQPAKPAEQEPLTREEIFEIAEPFGEFQYGDAQGHKRIDFANAIIAAYERKNGVQT